MKIAIVDDDSTEASRLSGFITSYTDHPTQITTYASGEEFLENWKPNDYDLIILDIFMTGMHGVEVASSIRQKDPEVCLVFCSTSNEFASESYEVGASYYLLKPVTEEKIRAMLDRLDLESLEQTLSVLLPDGQRILLQNILYTECSGHIITIHVRGARTVSIRMTQKQIEELLCSYPYFVNCFKGIIVNLNDVSDMTDQGFRMSDHHILPISRRKAKEIKDIYAEFRFQQMRKMR